MAPKEPSDDLSPSKSQGVPSYSKSKSLNKKKDRAESVPELYTENTNNSIKSDRARRAQERQENAHYERNYQSWQQTKKQSRKVDHRKLQEKLSLQKELVRRQDEIAEKRKDHKAKELNKKRDLDKLVKNEIANNLLEICKESLDDDTSIPLTEEALVERDRAALEQRRAARKARREAKGASCSQVSVSPTPSGNDPYLRPERISTVSFEEKRFSPVIESPDSGAEKGDVPTADDDSYIDPRDMTEEQLSDLPWHALQLYQLYGREAHDYLHPKMEEGFIKPLNPKLRGYLNENGHMSAGELWHILRGHSIGKLLRLERRLVSNDLKNTYSAFVRLNIDQNKKPIRRNFYSVDDIPELDILLDHSIERHVNLLRKKRELMFRSSINNQDKAAILEHNNPIPNLVDREGKEGIDRIIPEVDDTVSESIPSYEKWLKPKQRKNSSQATFSIPDELDESSYGDTEADEQSWEDDEEEEGEYDDDDDTGDTNDDNEQGNSKDESLEKSQEEDFSYLTVEKKTKKKQKNKKRDKLYFLTEKEATVKGEFTQKYKELAKAGAFEPPREGEVKLPPIDPERTSLVSNESPKSSRPEPRGSHSAPSMSREEFLKRFTSYWHPLTMNAITEYTRQEQVLGQGPFRHGDKRVYSAATTYN